MSDELIHMTECSAISGNKHRYDKAQNKRCPFCVEEMKNKSLNAPIVPITTDHGENLIELLQELQDAKDEIAAATGMPPQHPPLCTDCNWIATSYDKDFHKFRCLNPKNNAGINVVDGSKVYLYEFCWQLRSNQNKHPEACCDYEGKGFKKATQRPVASIDYTAVNVTPLGPRKVKVTDADLDNL